MTSINGPTKFSIIAKLAALDLIAGLCLSWLVIDDPRRTPFLIVAIPMVVAANIAIAWWRFRSSASITLPIVYLLGFAFGVIWTVEDFEWWKVPVLLVPLALFILNVQRFRRALTSEPKH